MTTITLKIRNSKVRQVQAVAKKDDDGGNAVLLPQGSIEWKATGSDVFRVIFFDLDKEDWVWPFEGNDDGVFGPHNAPSLEVTGAGKTRVLRSDAPPNIKYAVHAASVSNADPLDPMIIVRPPSTTASDGVLLGTVCAVLGAAAGAAAYALMS